MTLLQAALIALFAYLAWIGTPWLGGQGIGWYVFGRPLIAGTIVGIILGDVQSGMIVGATINALYIGAITPGGAMAADINFAGYVGAGLALATHVTAGVAVSIAVPIGLVGTFTWQLFATLNSVLVHKTDEYAAKAELGKFTFMLLGLPQIIAFIIRFVPAFIVLGFGTKYATSLVHITPDWLTHMLTVIGGMLPALGMAVLLKMLLAEKRFLAYFIIGFVAIAALKLPIFTVALVGIALAMISLTYSRGGNANA